MRGRPPGRSRPRVSRALALALTLVLAGATTAACGSGSGGGDDDGPATVTGRVMSLNASSYCVSRDRGETQTCVDVPDARAVEGVDVGECVTTTKDLTSEGSFVKVVDDAECAAGDLGDNSRDGGGD